ncbi:FAD dependent oxidoreductase [Aspergillus tamarii]|uniref:FAD dependent oxidoreductase n=1 Tax=Aspergillus tamarii TaxID=41984 RepID=A0A5N6U9Z7_ASPTM|nr:FAD dependent oxidoreductase [Aspergillus tamarii]
MAEKHVVVLGAGVIGLQTALTLLSRNVHVTLLSASWPGTLSDPYFTSMFSGAQWRSNPDRADRRQQTWDRTTLLHWRRLVKLHPPAELGLEIRSAEFYWDAPGPLDFIGESHWWISDRELVPVRRLSSNECTEKGFPSGVGISYLTVAVNPEIYCRWLLRQCEGATGARFGRRTVRVKSLTEALQAVPGAKAVVNCAGLGAQLLAHDEACFPTKGQTVLVRGQARAVVTRRNEEGDEPWEALVIPRPGERVTTLGGCKIAGDWNTEPDNRMTETILDRCKPLAPELLNEKGKFEVLEVRVGLRPSRRGGPMVEAEDLGDGQLVVHNYGHNSAGFEGSVGAAEDTAALLLSRWEGKTVL